MIQRKHYIVGGIILGALVLIALLYWLFFKKDIVNQGLAGLTTGWPSTPFNSGPSGTRPFCTSYRKESFPLKKCMQGEKVKQLQRYLGITADGKFGPNTEAALKKSTIAKSEVSGMDYTIYIETIA